MTAARVTCRRSIGLAILSSLATLGLAAGCPVVGNPPTDTIIACENNAGCPQGWECLPSGRCLATGDGAGPAPQIIAVDVSPAPSSVDLPSRVRVGVPLLVTLTLDVDAITVDEVALVSGETRLAMSLDTEASAPGDRQWAFRYVPNGSEAPGEYAMSVSLLSDALGRLADPSVVSAVFDFTPPTLVGRATVSPAAARSGDDVNIGLAVSEAVALVLTGRQGEAALALGAASVRESLDVVLTTTLPAGTADGVWTIEAQLTDDAGHEVTTTLLETLRTDTTEPSIIAESVLLNPLTAKAGDLLGVSLEADESLSVPPVVVMVAAGTSMPEISWGEGALVGARYAYSLSAPSVSSGAYEVFVRDLIDEVGNASTDPVRLGEVTLDNDDPAIANLTLNGTVFSLAPGRDTLALTFDGEDVDGLMPGLDARLGELPFTCAPWSATSPNYTCTLTLDASSPTGAQLISVVITDAAGNVDNVSLAVVIDVEPPTVLTDDVSITPTSARPGQAVAVTVAVSEPVLPGAVLTVEGDGAPIEVTADNTSASSLLSFAFAATGASGARTLTLGEVVDVAGNSSAATSTPLGDVTVDGDAPEVLALAADADRYSAEPGNNLIEITAEVAADAADVAVRLVPGAGAVGSEVELVCDNVAGATSTVSCLYDVPPLMPGDPRAETEGAWTVALDVADPVGNLVVSTTQLVLDFRAPDLIGPSVTVTYAPAPDNPLTTVSSATASTGVQVGFTLDETTGPPPDASVQGRAWPVSLVSQVNTSFLYAFTVEPVTPTEEALALAVSVEDAVGNRRDLTLSPAALRLDTSAPAGVPVATEDDVVHRRVPWGAEATGNTPNSVAALGEVIIAAGVLPADAVAVLVEDTNGNELGRASNPGGALTVALSGDAPVVTVSSVDDAGNVGPAIRVRDVAWTATLGGKNDGLTQNPTLLKNAPLFTPSFDQPGAIVPAGLAQAGGPGGELVRAFSSPGTWLPQGVDVPLTIPHVPGLVEPHLAYDAHRGVLVYFYTPGSLDRFYEHNGRQWTLSSPPTSPRWETKGDIAYDPHLQAIVLQGGEARAGAVSNGVFPDYGETWVWDGRDFTQQTLASDPVSNEERELAYHHDAEQPFGDTMWMVIDGESTWSWDHSASGWAEVPTTLNPASVGLVYDRRFARMVQLGSGDLVVYDAAASGWVNEGALAGPDSVLAVAWDERDDEVVVLGCSGGTMGVYALEQSALSLRATGVHGSCPSFMRLAFNGRTDHLVAYWPDGFFTVPARGDVPALTTFSNTAPTVPDVDHLAWDAARQQVVGVGPAGTWVRTNGVWTDTGVAPPAQRPLAYDRVRERVVMFSFDNSQSTYEWNGSSWQTFTTTLPQQWYGGDGTLEWDAGLEAVLLMSAMFGPVQRPALTWAYQGSGVWTDLAPSSSPPFLSCATAAYDERRRKMVMFSATSFISVCGLHADQVTYEYDSALNTWSVAPTTLAPTERARYAFVYSPDSGRILAYGGTTSYPAVLDRDDTWVYDGDWRSVPTVVRPPSGAVTASVYDPSTREIVMIIDGEEWIMPSTAGDRPAQILDVSLASAGFVNGADLLRGLRVRWDATGMGYPGGQPLDGVELFAWRGERWRRLAQSDTGQVTFTTDNARELRRLTLGAEHAMRFAAVPRSVNGTGGAEPFNPGTGWVATDYLEVELRYARAPAACNQDGVVDLDEECDDLSPSPGVYDCTAGCRLERCGDHVVQSALEECDDGNTVSGDGCSATCQVEVCGDGQHAPEVGELCDEGGVQTATCEAGCVPPACGDGIVNAAAGELCDDGNPFAFDGCSPTCGTNWTCDPAWYGGDECDCGCGDWDPDCRFETLTIDLCFFADGCPGGFADLDPNDPTQCL